MAYVWTTPKSDPDILAKNLIEWGKLAKDMPPAWEGAAISQGIGDSCGPIGRMLPGKGLLLKADLKELGITKRLPNVYERSPFLTLTDKWHRRKWTERARRAVDQNGLGYSSDLCDRLLSEHGAISTYDGIIAARAAGTGNPLDIYQFKPSVTTVAAQWHSLAMLAGTPGALASLTAYASNGAVVTAANTGSWNLPWTTPGSNVRYLLSFGFTAVQQINMCMLVDILVAASTVGIATQTFTTPALTRYTGGAGTCITMEVTTVYGGTTATTAFTYNNQAAASKSTTAAPVRSTAAIVSMLQPSVVGTAAQNQPWVVLATGDYGVQAVTAITWGGSTITTGASNLYIYFPLLWMPGIAANMYIERDSTTQIDGLIALAQDVSNVNGCLNVWALTNTTSTGIWNSAMRSCVG